MCIGNRFVPIVYKLLLLSAVLSGLYLSIFHLSDGFNGLALRYFTIQSNILVALAILFFLIYPRETRLRAIIRGSVLLSILVTGLVFHFILVPQLSDYFVGGIDLVNHLTHTIAPLGFILDWLLFDRKGQLKLADLPFWVIYPLLYWLVTVLQGAYTGFYPYFFMDVSLLGYGGALLWLAALIFFFSLLGLLLMGADRLLGRGVEPGKENVKLA